MKASLRFIIISVFFIASCNSKPGTEETEVVVQDSAIDSVAAAVKNQPEPQQMDLSNAIIEVKVFQNTTSDVPKGFGYDILLDGKLYIHQPHIPAVSGNRAFANEGDAKKAGDLVAYKLKNNIMPPSVTVEELDSLKVK